MSRRIEIDNSGWLLSIVGEVVLKEAERINRESQGLIQEADEIGKSLDQIESEITPSEIVQAPDSD
jgi:hypothetical protein